MKQTDIMFRSMIIAFVMIGTIGFAAATTVSIGDGNQVVTIPIMVEDVTDLDSCNLLLNFDETIVSVTSVTAGEMEHTTINDENTANGWIRVVAFQGAAEPLSGDITIAEVTFEPAGDPCSMSVSDMTITVSSLLYVPGQGQIEHTINHGEYVAVLCGDVNFDSMVDVADPAYLAKYLAGLSSYETIMCPGAADVDGSGYIDVADCSYLAKHLAGITGYEELLC